MKKKPVYLVVAVDEKWGIGKNGLLPWKLKKEIQYFAELTKKTQDPKKQNMLIMGRTTWESIPEKYRPLPGRINIVLTSNQNYHAVGAFVKNNLNLAISEAQEDIEKIFIIGGAQVFNEAISSPYLTGIYLTQIEGDFHCDTKFPAIPGDNFETKELGSENEGGICFKYLYLKKKGHI